MSDAVILGGRYRDTITGYEGTATGTASYLGGRWEALLSRRDQHGKPEDVWISVARLVEVPAAGPTPEGRPGFV